MLNTHLTPSIGDLCLKGQILFHPIRFQVPRDFVTALR